MEINEENFPDAGFREYLKTNPEMLSLHSDPNLFTADEIDSIKDLDMTNSSLEAESLAGIEHFKNLETLQCNGSFLKTIDVSKNTELLSLNCAETLNLTTLNVRNCTKLQTLDCYSCQLTDLDLSTNRLLDTLSCQNNQLQVLNVANNLMLTELSCGGNQLTALDVSNCPALESLSCGDNQLSELNITGNTALRFLFCRNNQLTEIDVQDKTSLRFFYTENNLLKTLDVSNCPDLTFFLCNDNQLEEIDVSKNSSLWLFSCQNNQLKTLDVSQNKSLGNLNCTGNRLKSLVLPSTGMATLTDCEQFDTIHVAADQDTYDLKTADPKLDGSKISNLTGAQRSGTGSILTNIQTGTDVTYTYDCGNGNTMHVTLRFLQTNRWIAELKISGWKYGDTPPNPSAQALYGEVQYLYSEAPDGDAYTADIPQQAGVWYVKAVVPETKTYSGLESAPVKFEISKAAPAEIILPENLNAPQGVPLSSVVLPQGWVWITPDETVRSDQKSYQAMLEVDDRNYDYSDVKGYDALKHGVIRELPVTVTAGEKTRLDITEGIREIPDTLIAAGMDTAEKITAELCRVVAENQGYSAENVMIYDVKLQISFDGGKTWNAVTSENFPAEGLLVALPYPEGTNSTDYDFIITHMFTHEMSGFKPGQTETLETKKTKEELQFTVHGLSPIAVAWKSVKTNDDDHQGGEDKPTVPPGAVNPPAPGADDVPVPPETGQLTADSAGQNTDSVSKPNTGISTAKKQSPQTGDHNHLRLWIFIMVLSGTGIFFLKRKQSML